MEYKHERTIFPYFIHQPWKMNRQNTFSASKWNFVLSENYFWFTLTCKKYFFRSFLKVGEENMEKCPVHACTPCKITTPTHENSGNKSKIRLASKISPFYTHFLPPWFLTKYHVNLSNFPDTPRLFWCAGSRERLVIRWKKQTPFKSDQK